VQVRFADEPAQRGALPQASRAIRGKLSGRMQIHARSLGGGLPLQSAKVRSVPARAHPGFFQPERSSH